MDIRVVLGNKCAGRHNLKTVYLKETLDSVNFLAWSSPSCACFCSALSTMVRRRQTRLYRWWRLPPTSSSWGCPGSTNSLPALISLSGLEKRLLLWNMANSEVWRSSWRFSPQIIAENSGGDGNLGDGLAMRSAVYRHVWSFKLKNHSKSLLMP